MRTKLSKWQSQILKDEHRFKVICAGRRAGKSVLSRMIVLGWALKNQGVYFIVSPTYRQSKMIHWRDFQKEIPREWIRKKNEQELSFTLKNGSIIELKGAENPDALRGVKLRGLVIDEIASIRNWNWLWSEVLRPTLTDYEAPAIFISTPKGFNHFHKLFEMGQQSGNDYQSWKFTSYDNPFIPAGEIDKAKEELVEDTFAQEYMADFRKFTGLVYKGFERNTHIIEPFDIPYDYEIVRGFDFGSTNPTVCLWIAIDNDDNWFVVKEHYESQQIIDYHAGKINAEPLSKRAYASYGDPSGAQWIQEFADRGIYITPATKERGTSGKNWVNLGIEKVAERLKPIPGHAVPIVYNKCPDDRYGEKGVFKMPKLFFFNDCINTIREFETYKWREKKVTQAQELNEPDVPEKANDHACDCARYVCISHKGRSEPNPITTDEEQPVEANPNRNVLPQGGGMADLF